MSLLGFLQAVNEDNTIFDKRDLVHGLSQDTRRAVDLITYDDKTLPVGSVTFKVHKYPGDVDIFEKVDICCTQETAIKKFASFFKDLVNQLDTQSTSPANFPIFWGDMKCGIDYKLEVLESDTIESYIERTREYLSEEDINDIKNHDEWKSFVRKFYILRWSPEEISLGKKKLKSGGTISLEECITHNAVLKLDLWATVNGNYTEVTNFYLVSWNDGSNKYVLNPDSLGDRKQSLLDDIKNFSSYSHWKPLKLAKRMWNLSIFEKNWSRAAKLAPLFSTGVASLSQIEGEIEVIRFILDKYGKDKSCPYDKFIEQVTRFKRRLNDINDIDDSVLLPQKLYRMIDTIVDLIKYPSANTIDIQKLIEHLQKLEDTIHDIITVETNVWIKEALDIEKPPEPPKPVYVMIGDEKVEIKNNPYLQNLIKRQLAKGNIFQ